MQENLPYKTYGEFLAERFPWKMQKLSVDIGFSCPNRDGTLGYGGCIYCDNTTFVPAYCNASDSITTQLEKGKKFFRKKYPDLHYLAYFQAYTSTYSTKREILTDIYRQALLIDDVEGIIISTRPDCIDEGLISQIKNLAVDKRIMFEIGVETWHDETLKLINRNHAVSDVIRAVRLITDSGMDVGLHLIMGLPGETEEMMLQTIVEACSQPITSLKLHQLQIIKGTPLHKLWEIGEIEPHIFTVEEYIDFCKKAITVIPRNIAIERFTASAPPSQLIAPKWGIKNYEFVHLLNKAL